MKKSILLILVLLLLLTACQTVPDNDQSMESTPSSTVPTTAPTTQPTSPTSESQTAPPNPYKAGRAVIYKGSQSSMGSAADCSGCTVGHLYWVDSVTEKITPILEEPVLNETQDGNYVYYVKTAEPTKVYVTNIGAFTEHLLFYESAYGNVDYMTVVSGLDDYLQMVADHKKFVILDMITGESTVLMEQYHIDYGYMPGTGDGITWANYIWFQGKPTENDPPYLQYYYYRDTGITEEDDSL